MNSTTMNTEAIEQRLGGNDNVWNKLRIGHDNNRDGIIEASAGTGKTYSLQSIVLKLLSEGIVDSVTNILLVTFTEKAAGELRDKIRQVLADNGCLPPDFDEMTICTIHSFCRELLTEYAFENHVPMETEVGSSDADLIHRAVQETIKGKMFRDKYQCGFPSLMEAAGLGDSNQLARKAENRLHDILESGDETVPAIDTAGIQNSAVPLLSALGGSDLAAWAQDGVSLHGTDARNAIPRLTAFSDLLPVLVHPEKSEWLSALCGWGRLYGNENSFNPRITGMGRGTHRLYKEKPELRPLVEALAAACETASGLLSADLAVLSIPAFRRLKDQANLLTFDDMVRLASDVIDKEAQRGGSALLDAIRRKYRIALVDEFQDTDSRQWTIFENLFSHKHNDYTQRTDAAMPKPQQGFLLVVGDPKQAIYSFRGADVATYLKAKDAITGDDAHGQPAQSLDRTFRSAPALVDAFNRFFQSGWFADMVEGESSISYSANGVLPPPTDDPKTKSYYEFQDCTGCGPVQLLESLPRQLENPESSKSGYGNSRRCLPIFLRNAAAEMKRLCARPCAYTTKNPQTGETEPRRYSYGDMCVLVRGNAEAATTRVVLAEAGIPYSQYKEAGLFASDAAEALLALFDFLAAPGRRGRREALLLTSFFNVPPSQLEARLAASDPVFSALVDRWQELIAKRDWNHLFESFLDDTELAKPAPDDADYDRRWTSVRQILDKLLEAKGRSARIVDEFAEQLRSWRKDDSGAGENGSLRRKESEADRVQIMTMHASKGLEFKVVFIASGFKDPTYNAEEEDKPATLREEKRLLYVALTRAQHKLYLPWSKWAEHQRNGQPEIGIGSIGSPLLGGFLAQGILAYFGNAAAAAKAVIDPVRDTAPAVIHSVKEETSQATPLKAQQFEVFDVPYLQNRRLQWDSFTSLNHHASTPKAETDGAGERDEAGTETSSAKAPTLLPRTSVSGDVFHTLMELLCNNDDSEGHPGFMRWGETPLNAILDESGEPDANPYLNQVRRAMQKHALRNRVQDDDSTERTLARMAWNVLNTEIHIGDDSFKLKDVTAVNRRAEMEFVVDEKALLGVSLPELGGRPRDGVFNGKIDLLVRPQGPNGPVYVLDWKTNSLGGYDHDHVAAAMDEAGYHLQYQLYSLAVRQWLGQGRPNGVAYLFVRGGEKEGGSSGVYSEPLQEGWRTTCLRAVLEAIPNGKKED